jgi:putative ABC transport system substrate-binding protein
VRGKAVGRREFIAVLAVAAAVTPHLSSAQERMRRIGVFLPLTAGDPESQARNAAFLQALMELGWHVGRNLRIEYRWNEGNPERARRHSAEMVALAPEVILAPGTATAGPLIRATRAIPIVFVHVPDPVGSGFVDSLAKPGGNATGFLSYEYGMSGKWLELLKEMVPQLARLAVIRDPAIPSGMGQFGAIQALAPSLGLDISPINVRDAGEIERGVAAFARSPNGALIVTSSGLASLHSKLIVRLAARHKLPAIYWERSMVAAGGLMSYGPDFHDQYRRAAGYIHRILKGEKPAELPVQAPTKFELVINQKTAKALGIAVPPTLLARADEVIE